MATLETVTAQAQSGNVKAQMALAEYHMNQHELDFAEHWYIQASEKNDDALTGLAIIYMARDETDKANDMYLKLYERNKSEIALGMIIKYYTDVEKHMDALKYALKLKLDYVPNIFKIMNCICNYSITDDGHKTQVSPKRLDKCFRLIKCGFIYELYDFLSMERDEFDVFMYDSIHYYTTTKTKSIKTYRKYLSDMSEFPSYINCFIDSDLRDELKTIRLFNKNR